MRVGKGRRGERKPMSHPLRLKQTLRTLRGISSNSELDGIGPEDATLVNEIDLVLCILKQELEALSADDMSPELALSLSRLYLTLGQQNRALSHLRKAAEAYNQNRGFYIDFANVVSLLVKENPDPAISSEIIEIAQDLLAVCPFPDDLRNGLPRRWH